MQIVEQTHDEKIKMYMKCTKTELIQMLIQCNKHLSKTKVSIKDWNYGSNPRHTR